MNRFTALPTLPNAIRHQHTLLKTTDLTQAPDFTKYSPVKPIKEGIAPYIVETMKAFPTDSRYINQQHYYQNRNILMNDYAKRTPHPVSLMQLAQYYDDSSTLTKQKIINSGIFVKEELVIRIASKINLLQSLPFNVVNNFHFLQVYESYYNIFERFRKFPAIKTMEDNLKFSEFIRKILQDFNSLNLPHLIMGALECTIFDLYPRDKMDELLSNLLRSRISRRLIVEEHLSVTSNYVTGKKENTLVLGDIFQECNALQYLTHASKECEQFIRNMYYPTIPLPELKIEGCTDLNFYFLPTHLKYLLGEILRNAYEATIREYIRKGSDKPAPIVVTIIENPDTYIFRISDQAGGLIHSDADLWSFGKSKERARESLNNFHKLPGLHSISIYDDIADSTTCTSSSMRAVEPYMNTSLAHTTQWNINKGHYKLEQPLIELLQRPFRYKLGVGLAMCKVYAEYWNGDLRVHSMPGYGVDAVLTLGNLMKSTAKKQLDKV
ncbi:similar to Saccharomyces cerevisiae YGL059W PKP2 Mitochondrial protein kinase [Maudiozyma barnettii]|uniref:Protein-serine/threonine kinase n=1 Tax=Maudiozyma barnettii TaxID=61262 RepID=A0A8H2VI55_9SACH|nr:protein kinase PKP2 [Kazachstania barnettii]CAB4255840.1 similar to Saccharomyces cerevisiae YGL059W PKP2 Mitochondrial protein kinase [Kazachstania barnettii]CAD1784401.1 similar to Saccharomyces cerevisiae YGL059W PKP2 Mitochondrial protein kinase [Kazachstania barnettii]